MAKEVILDCMGEACPIPLVKAENSLKELEVGVDIEEVDDGEWEIIIEKAK